MNLFYTSLDNRISKFKVYNVHTMADEFMVVSGMPNRIGELIIDNFLSSYQELLTVGSRKVELELSRVFKHGIFVEIYGTLALHPPFKHSLL